MKTISVKLLDEDALNLLHQLEKFNIIRVISDEPVEPYSRRSWAGSISKTTADKMINYLNQSRDEWERGI